MSEALLKRIDSKLTHIIMKPAAKKETWVKSTVILELTGKDRQWLRTARKNAYVEWKKNDNGFWYLLESMNEIFVKKQLCVIVIT